MRFSVGDQFMKDGIEYRVVAGNRCDGDMVIEWRQIRQGWHRPSLSHTFILTSFKYQVEQNNYGVNGKIKRGKGGRYLLEAVEGACLHGWEHEVLKVERQVISR